MKAWTNRAELIGAFEGDPEYSHTAHDRNFYKARLMCVRHSGKADYIPIIIPESRVDFKHRYKDDFCAITGQVRTYNNRKTNRLEMTVYADDITIIRYIADTKNPNITAGPPSLGIVLLCVLLLSLGISTAPIFFAIFIVYGVATNATTNANIKAIAISPHIYIPPYYFIFFSSISFIIFNLSSYLSPLNSPAIQFLIIFIA